MKKQFNKSHKAIRATNSVDSATTKSKDWGCVVPSKFGKTTNHEITKEERKREGL